MSENGDDQENLELERDDHISDGAISPTLEPIHRTYQDLLKQEPMSPSSEEDHTGILPLSDGPLSSSLTPLEIELAPGGVWARRLVALGQRYGPFTGAWLARAPENRNYAWEVLASSGIRGWLDGTNDPTNWLKYIRSSNDHQEVNVQQILLGGQLWYSVVRDLRPGQELVIGPRDPLSLHDVASTTNAVSSNEVTRLGSGTVGSTLSSSITDTNASTGATEDDFQDEDSPESEPRCSFCDASFADIDQLDSHLVRQHGQPYSLHPCERCGRSYSARILLLKHRALVHAEIKKYPCENCTKVFTDPSNLQRHIRARHVGARSHACPECGKTFGTSSGLKQHTHIHSSHKPFQCEVCLKAYTQFSNLCRHKRMHADCRMQIKCVKCGQSFSTVTSLSKHKRFCDSTATSTPQTGTTGLQGLNPLANLPLGNQGAPIPFSMYRSPGPGLPFPFPPNFPHYPSLFSTSAPSGLLANSLLFNSQAPRSPMELEFTNNNLSLKNKSLTPDRRSSASSMEFLGSPDIKRPRLDKISERVQEDRISPRYVRSNDVSSSSTDDHLSMPSKSLFGKDDKSLPTLKYGINLNLNNNEPACDIKIAQPPCEVKDLSKSSQIVSPTIKENDINESSKPVPNGEQPLDLSLSRKRRHSDKSFDNNSFRRSSSVKSFTPPDSPAYEHDNRENTKSPENEETTEVDVEEIRRSVSPQPSRLNKLNPNSVPAMAYPRPVHPMFLEAMYRPGGFHGFPSTDRMLVPPHSHFVPSGAYPFLAPLLGGNGASRADFDMLHGPPSGFSVAKFRELSGSGVPGSTEKIRDRYACKFCGKIFPRSANLTRHLRTHTGEQPYRCQYCERSFSISSNLQRHVRNIHNKEKPFRCPLCERCFGQQTNLDRHLKKHDSEGAEVSVADSPSSADTEREESYFDEIRSFMGKVGCSPPLCHSPSPAQRPCDSGAIAVST